MNKPAPTVTVTTPTCPVCGQADELVLPADGHMRWLSGELVQEALPGLPAADREVLVTGIHPACWNEMFPPEDDR